MLYNLLYPYADQIQLLNVFKYLSFRSAGAILTSLFLSFILGPYTIRKMKELQHGGQPLRDIGPDWHKKTKTGTPTMGGLFILASMVISTILWTDLTNPYIWIVLFVTIGYGLIGFIDDYLKVTKRNTKGVSGKTKLIFQSLIAIIAILFINHLSSPNYQNMLTFPFFKRLILNLGVFYYLFTLIVIVGASNAVNLTDGLDGLAIVPIIIAASCFGIISYLIGNSVFASYLQIHHVAGAGELAILMSSIVGAGLGFLWYNAPPAKIFMGDIGSLALGGSIGTVSVITKHEIALAIIGGLFVIEALSVIIQVYYFKFTGGKRIFLMAPLHHHFEKKGWSESTVVMRFWIIAVVFALIGLSSLKLR
jgi:phospho-N-acetylmuramoyl-pentapeptide-transferase